LKQVVLAFDYGDVRTGVAIYDGSSVEPLVTLMAENLWPDIASLIVAHRPSQLVVGLPRNLNGEPTDQTKKAQSFADSLAQISQLPVATQDEAMSSKRALDRIDKKATIAQRKKIIDQVAAQIILEDFIS
jgi:putative Holliday junction resolvase